MTNQKSIKKDGVEYFVEETDDGFYFFAWWEGEKVRSRAIDKDKIGFIKEKLTQDFYLTKTNILDVARSIIDGAIQEVETAKNRIVARKIIEENYQRVVKARKEEIEKIWKRN